MEVTGREARVAEYWDWLAGALFLLVTVDMITTVYAARSLGIGHEANPVMRMLLVEGPVVYAVVNLAVVVAAVLLFSFLVDRLERTPAPYDRYLAVGIEVWLGGLLAAGLLLFANNLAVIFFARSLL